MKKLNLPLRHNQLIVARNFSSLRDGLLDLHDKDRDARLSLLLTEVIICNTYLLSVAQCHGTLVYLIRHSSITRGSKINAES